MKIQGTTPPDKEPGLLVGFVMGIFMFPLAAIGGYLLSVAVDQAAKDRATELGTLAIACVGLAFTWLYLYLIWKYGFWLSSVRITRFSLDERRLRIQTPRREYDITDADVASWHEHVGRKTGSLGWWLRLNDHGWLLLPKENPQARKLIARLDKLRSRSQG